MPSRNLFVLAAAMQLPLALWLHGCKDDDEKKEEETTTTPEKEETAEQEDQPTTEASKLHADYFLNGRAAEAVAEMMSDKFKKKVTFEKRSTVFEQYSTEVRALAMGAYLNESNQNMLTLTGPNFDSYQELVDEWRSEFIPDEFDNVGRAYQMVSPASFSVSSLQFYMLNKQHPVMMNNQQSQGHTSAETLLIDAVGSTNDYMQVNQQYGQRQIPERMLIVTEIFTTAYKTKPHNPKSNPYNVAVTYFQVTQDLNLFFDVCMRAFNQILSFNQLLEMKVDPKQEAIFVNCDPDERFDGSNAWELYVHIEKTGDEKWERRPAFGSRAPNQPYKFYNAKTIQDEVTRVHELQKQIISHVVTDFSRYGSFYQVQGKFGHFLEKDTLVQIDLKNGKHFHLWMEIALTRTEDSAGDKLLNMLKEFKVATEFIFKDAKDFAALPEMKASGNEILVVAVEEFVDIDALSARTDVVVPKIPVCPDGYTEIFKWNGDCNRLQMTTKIKGQYWGRLPIKANEDQHRMCLPKFIMESFFEKKELMPTESNVHSWEKFLRKQNRAHDRAQYVMPNVEHLMTLDDYKIQVLEVLHPGSSVSKQFSEVMLVAFFHAFRATSSNYYNHGQSIILGNSNVMFGGNDFNENNSQPHTRGLTWDAKHAIPQLRFVSIEEETEEFECFETIAIRLKSEKKSETHDRHEKNPKKVSKTPLQPKKASDKSRIGSHLRAMQN